MILSVTGGLIYAYFSGLAFAGLSQRQEAAAHEGPQPAAAGQTSLVKLASGDRVGSSRRAA
jgi:hypothetical protein